MSRQKTYTRLFSYMVKVSTRLAASLIINLFLDKFEDEPWKSSISWFVYTWLCCLFTEWDVKHHINENYSSNTTQPIPPSAKSQPDSIFYLLSPSHFSRSRTIFFPCVS